MYQGVSWLLPGDPAASNGCPATSTRKSRGFYQESCNLYRASRYFYRGVPHLFLGSPPASTGCPATCTEESLVFYLGVPRLLQESPAASTGCPQLLSDSPVTSIGKSCNFYQRFLWLLPGSQTTSTWESCNFTLWPLPGIPKAIIGEPRDFYWRVPCKTLY